MEPVNSNDDVNKGVDDSGWRERFSAFEESWVKVDPYSDSAVPKAFCSIRKSYDQGRTRHAKDISAEYS
jgi:transglutaminase-like putative cysteine protease